MGHQAFAWLLLVASVLAEVIGTVALRYTDGFTRPLPSLLTAACYAGAIWWMAVAVRHLEVGLTYAIWAGCGTALTALVGIVWFGESAGMLRLAGLAMIVGGVVALNLSGR
ncbi:DMT family transporter [Piscinibacter gummiphilus]|uniref:Uncharacterized protein n=1 Tax=Piscinibacter gummiphilus TaxID=946333 RepID=A0A1W6LBT9_9BURK|nr:multidrug efflux SMR transporter [Piscinibacter gummiphilus]ARN21716.1 hypothetical protein A4W93_18460 [Piscinibacter gummiphilus]ATU66402.1 QacE family quaternary ammonium compound efflux SMR transporter [Piscinibacter gummiphilus]GLS95711.1 QacE family quaternary ammonium compound efflux SMR transporter [Piscinibacter gummiphilus]